jgi:xanthine dehydrogenase iron-sulfur cluster and FAD-binding subunit A
MVRLPTCMFCVLLVASVIQLGDSSEEAFDEAAAIQDAPEVLPVEDVTVEEKTAVPVDEERVEYARGSVCGYCTYCKFCKLCDKDCPCETSHSKPNCHMCKYCKYCNLCSALCDTICTPGGILDRVSGAIVNSLPSFNKDEVDGDIANVQHWIEKKRDEL